MDERRKYICIDLLFACAVLIVLYPFFASVWNEHRQQQMIVSYEASASQIADEDYASYTEAAQAWNRELYAYMEPGYFPDSLTDDEIYESLLNINGDGMMGYVSIPKINVNLPIYHYADDEVLLKGTGHLAASALPVGGESTHCVITAHRGLPTARMFTDLDQMEIGDVFCLNVLGETYAYEVIEIQETSPDETQSLLPVEGKDLCTLVTCTPYGINTMRLLVTGMRTAVSGEADETESSASSAAFGQWYLILIAAAESAVYIFVRHSRENRHSSKNQEETI